MINAVIMINKQTGGNYFALEPSKNFLIVFNSILYSQLRLFLNVL